MATIDEIKRKALELSEKTDSNSITPKEVGGIMHDLASLGENAIRNGGTLGIRKVYESVAAMEADSISPVDLWGNPIKKGNLVVIYDGTTTGTDNNKVYAFMNPGWELVTYLDAGYATRSEVKHLSDEVEKKADEKLTTAKLNELTNEVASKADAEETNEKLSELGKLLLGIEIEWTLGLYIKTDGVTASSAAYGITNSISLKVGDILTVNYYGSQYCVVASVKDGVYTPIYNDTTADPITKKEYSYEAVDSIEVVVCGRRDTGYETEVNVILKAPGSLKNELNSLREDVSLLNGEITEVKLELYGDGETDSVEYSLIQGFISDTGNVTLSDAYSYTSPIFVEEGETLEIEYVGRGLSVISITNESGSYYTPYYIDNSGGVTDKKIKQYKAESTGYISVSGRTDNGYSINIKRIVIKGLIGRVIELENRKDLQRNETFEIYTHQEGLPDLSATLNTANHSVIYDMCNELAAQYPSFVTIKDIGTSVNGQIIKAVEIMNPNGTVNNTSRAKRHLKVFVVAALHGYEQMSAYCLIKFFEDILSTRLPLNDFLLNYIDYYIIPVANPDGFDAGTRGNANGVDLNRNFEIGWVSLSGGYYSGESAASEPETQAIIAYRQTIPYISYYIDIHNIGDGTSLQPVFYVNDDFFASLGERFFAKVSAKWIKDYNLSGDNLRTFGRISDNPTTGTSLEQFTQDGVKGCVFETPWRTPFASKKYDKTTLETSVDLVGNLFLELSKN